MMFQGWRGRGEGLDALPSVSSGARRSVWRHGLAVVLLGSMSQPVGCWQASGPPSSAAPSLPI